MKKRIAWLLMGCLVVLSLMLASCAKPAPTAPTAPAAPAGGETLGEILGRAAGVASMQYDLVMTAPGAPTMTQKVWVKKNKMRMEMTQQEETQIILTDIDAQTMYVYMPAENMAMKMNFSQATKSATEEAGSIQNYNPTVVGTETIDGKVCLVVEYTAGGAATKAWIWEEHGFPIRVEVTTSEGTTTVEYKNIGFVDILDSKFELPAGVQIIQPGS
jgi:outer membrane lipoprotein-sorting protein